MNLRILCACLPCLCSSIGLGQLPLDEQREIGARNQRYLVQTLESGMYARDLAGLVAASPVKIRGRWGMLEGRSINYGLGVTREDVLARGVPEAIVDNFGFPEARYAILIDEVIKGDAILADATVLTLATTESPDILDKAMWLRAFRQGGHLFFLERNVADTSYVIRGDMFDMKRAGDGYVYGSKDAYTSIVAPPEYIPVFGSENAEAFIEAIRALAGE